jgi:predicted dehydrogenase
MASSEELTWAIMGTGAVAHRFASALTSLGQAARLVEVASRDPTKASAFAGRYQARAVSYQEAAQGPARAIYIATPPTEHERHALMAISAGKAVLVEKPFASDAAAALRIAQAARSAGVFCMEAMWTRFQPLVIDIKQRIQAGAIGNLRQFEASFCIADQPDAQGSLEDPQRGGGALMHRGVYGISLAHFFLGPTVEVSSTARLNSVRVDEDCVVTMRHQSGALSVIRASLRTNSRNGFNIMGDRGIIEVDPPIFRPPLALQTNVSPRRTAGVSEGSWRDLPFFHQVSQRLAPLLRSASLRGARIQKPYAGNGYTHEALAVAAGLDAKLTENALMTLDDSVAVMTAIDQARANWLRGTS